MTKMQRVAFFRLANVAHRHAGDGTPFDAWRKHEMSAAIPGCDSVSKVGMRKEYELLMLHFAILAEDFDLVAHYAVGQESRLRWVLRAIEADLEFMARRGVDDSYMAAIYHQAGYPSYHAIDDVPSEALRLIVQIADSYVRKLRKAAGLDPADLPSAGSPWCIRGHRAAEEAALRRSRVG